MDLISGIWNIFKNESHFAATSTTVFNTSLNGQLAGTGLVELLNTQPHMNVRPDYFVTNDSLALTYSGAIQKA